MKLRLGYELRYAFPQHSVPTRLRASGYGRTRLWTTPSELDRPILTPSRHTIGATALATAGPLCFVRRFRARRQVFEGWSVLQFNITASRKLLHGPIVVPNENAVLAAPSVLDAAQPNRQVSLRHGCATRAALPPHPLPAAFASTVHNRTFRYTRAEVPKHPSG